MKVHPYLCSPNSCWLRCFSFNSQQPGLPTHLCQVLCSSKHEFPWLCLPVSAFLSARAPNHCGILGDLRAKGTKYLGVNKQEDTSFREKSISAGFVPEQALQVMVMRAFHKYIFLGESDNHIFIPMTDECIIGLELAIIF